MSRGLYQLSYGSNSGNMTRFSCFGKQKDARFAQNLCLFPGSPPVPADSRPLPEARGASPARERSAGGEAPKASACSAPGRIFRFPGERPKPGRGRAGACLKARARQTDEEAPSPGFPRERCPSSALPSGGTRLSRLHAEAAQGLRPRPCPPLPSSTHGMALSEGPCEP